jgi:uncharacterized damage-inducible protein DinB
MYLKIDDFIEDWKEESESTMKIFIQIPDEARSAREHVSLRSLERLAWHITQSLTEMPKSAGITGEDPLVGKDIPGSMKEINEEYRKYSARLISELQKNCRDKDLTNEINIYGQVWQLRKVLAALVKHEIHHRAQMTVLMRLQNLKVPGVYGPSKEEWSKYGMEAQE